MLEGKDFLGSLTITDSDRAFKIFKHDVVEAAMAFDLTLRQSISSYHFNFDPLWKQIVLGSQSLPPSQPSHLISISCLERAAIIDIKTGRRFTSKNIVDAKDQGAIGQRALVIYPALCCRRGTGELLLGKQLILAELLSLPRSTAKEKIGVGIGETRLG